MSRWVDVAFGAAAMLIAAGALIQVSEGFPAVVAAMLAIVGLAILVRGLVVAHPRRTVLTPERLAIAALCITAVHYAWRSPPMWLALQLGPPEYTALIVFELSVAVALAVSSRLRALGMALLGLLLGTVGTNIETGAERFTFGLIALVDGIPVPLAGLGLIVVADAALFAVSPTLALRLYARHLEGWTPPRVSWPLDIAARLGAIVAIMLAGAWALQLNNSWIDVRLLAALAVVGILARVLGLNRLVLLLAMGASILLEENIRRSLLLSRGDAAIFLQRPISASVILAACAVLCAAAALWVRARRASNRAAQSGSQLKMSAERSSL